MTTPAENERVADRYELGELLGRGGMASVYRATDVISRREVALKQLIAPEGAAARASTVALFEREFHTLAQLRHPHVIAVYDYGLFADGRPYYTMELLDGGDLRERAPLAWREVCRLLYEVCSSLALLHSRRLLHRDISPRNIRCTRDGHAKLIDFGAMAPMNAGGGDVVGTPAFIAPESLHRLAVDARSDLYSLGVTLYHALTGRVPYPATTFADVIAAWKYKVVPPSALAVDIPAALDDLVLALISLEPALRPSSAFEVMQRLAACAGLQQAESEAVSQAYLATPTLVGREAALDRFRDKLLASRLARGGALMIEGRSGVGRSRLLDACVLEAKTLGFTVMRATASGAREGFAIARHLTEHLLEALPSQGLRAAAPELFRASSPPPPGSSQPPPRPQLRDFADNALDRGQLQQAICRFWSGVSQTQPLLIAVDDVHRIDSESAAVLAALLDTTRQGGLFVLLSSDSDGAASEALSVLARRCVPLTVEALSRDETHRLLGSLFGEVPNLELLAREFHEVAGGNPRQCMDMAQHLVDRGLIRYAGGTWTLPSRLAAGDLPRSAEAALRARASGLSPEARFLGEAQALAFYESLSDREYRALLPELSSAAIDRALSELLALQALVTDGTNYTLANRLWTAVFSGGLDPEAARERHRALARMYEGRPIPSIHHLFSAGEDERGLDLLTRMNQQLSTKIDVGEIYAQNIRKMMWCYKPALETARRIGMSGRQLNDLRRWCAAGSATMEEAAVPAVMQQWYEQLEHDSGLDLYRKDADNTDRGARLTAALQGAYQRYLDTPEAQRVYAVDEAIRLLAEYVLFCIVRGGRAHDPALLSRLPGILEPFAPLAPMLDAIWNNAQAAYIGQSGGRVERARELWLGVLEKLAAISGGEMVYVDAIANAVSFAIGLMEAELGLPTATSWADKLDRDPSQRVAALQLRRIVRLEQGDWTGAERLRRQIEVLTLQNHAPQLFQSLLLVELNVCVKAGDLAGIKDALDRMRPIVAEYPGWLPHQMFGEASFELVRGDAEAARRKSEEVIALTQFDAAGISANAFMFVAGQTCLAEALLELGKPEEARANAARTLEQWDARQTGSQPIDLVRVLSLAEARLGDPRGVERMEAAIAQQLQRGVTGLKLGLAYETRALIAIWQKDGPSFERYAELTGREYRYGAGSALGARYDRLMNEAGRHGLRARESLDSLEAVRFESSAYTRDLTSFVSRSMASTNSADARAHAALQMICVSRNASGGHLFLSSALGLHLSATFGSVGAAPQARELEAFVQRATERDEEMDEMSTGELAEESASALTQLLVGTTEYELLLLACVVDEAQKIAGVAAVSVNDAPIDVLQQTQLLRALASHLLV